MLFRKDIGAILKEADKLFCTTRDIVAKEDRDAKLEEERDIATLIAMAASPASPSNIPRDDMVEAC